MDNVAFVHITLNDGLFEDVLMQSIRPLTIYTVEELKWNKVP